jgi:hypothetical protein
VPKD